MIKKFIKYLVYFSVVFFCVLIIFEPEICRKGAFSGIVICGKIIIPSLFPFTMCVLFITRTNIFARLKCLNILSLKVFGLNFNETVIMLFSFLGGYPVGAKLLNTAVKRGEISSKKAGIMLGFCVNAGPAFIVGAVGNGILNSKKIGYILLLCHIMSSMTICLFLRKLLLKNGINKKSTIKNSINLSDNFVISSAEASGSVLGVCGFVILFSVISGYVIHYADSFPILRIVGLGLEVTNSVKMTNNLYLISFLLGFAGLCIWCQILSVTSDIKINFFEFIIYRICNGIFGSVFLYLFLKIFKVSVETSSFKRVEYVYSTPVLSVSMLLMCIVFAISVASEKYAGKILDDVI